MAKVSAQISQ